MIYLDRTATADLPRIAATLRNRRDAFHPGHAIALEAQRDVMATEGETARRRAIARQLVPQALRAGITDAAPADAAAERLRDRAAAAYRTGDAPAALNLSRRATRCECWAAAIRYANRGHAPAAAAAPATAAQRASRMRATVR